MRAILTLHSVDDSDSVLSIRPGQLESLLDAIDAAGHEVVALSDLLRYPGIPDRVAITFDDALASVAEEGLPTLARRGITAAVFVVTDRVGITNQWAGQPREIPRIPSMGWSELEALAEAGWEIGSHTATHARLDRLTEGQVEDEIHRAHAAIQQSIGIEPEVFAYPYGACNASTREIVGGTYRFAVGGRLAELDGAADHPLELPRLDGYYLRNPSVHRWFGSPALDGWLELRRLGRAARARLGR